MGPVPSEKPRNVCRQPVAWADGAKRLEVLGESLLVINWLNGVRKCQYHIYNGRVRIMHQMLEQMVQHIDPTTRATADWGGHNFRELNTEADELASRHCFAAGFDGHILAYRHF